MNKLLLAFVIIGAAFANEQVINTIKRIDSTQFGRTLFDTIYLQLEANEPIDRLLQTLDELEARYVAEQKEDDERNREFQDACNVDIAAYDKDINESDVERITLEARLEGQLYPQREILTQIVKQKQQELRAYQADLQELDETREAENEVFEEKVNEHTEADAVISEARRIFTEGISGSSFIQNGGKINPKATVSAEKLVLIQKHFLQHAKKFTKVEHRKSYGKIFKVLATITSRISQVAEEGAVQKIVTLFDNLLKQIEDSLDLERYAEEKRVEAYKKSRNLLVIQIRVTDGILADTQVQLAQVLDQIRFTEASLENVNQRLAIKSEERSDRYNQCEEAAQDYEQARASRTSDRDVVSQTIGLVNAQLRTLREQLALRQAAGEQV